MLQDMKKENNSGGDHTPQISRLSRSSNMSRKIRCDTRFCIHSPPRAAYHYGLFITFQILALNILGLSFTPIQVSLLQKSSATDQRRTWTFTFNFLRIKLYAEDVFIFTVWIYTICFNVPMTHHKATDPVVSRELSPCVDVTDDFSFFPCSFKKSSVFYNEYLLHFNNQWRNYEKTRRLT